MNKIFSIRFASRRLIGGLALAGVVGAFAVAGISTANAQSTSGSIFGKAPAGYTVSARSTETGGGRTVVVDSSGRYAANALPSGTYNVILKQIGHPVAEHKNVEVIVGRGVEVDFDCSKIKCAAPAAN
ncbi:MAG: carboxypeptidase regulatory-like domain-containing protein [Xanthomonadaceae bacterium]|nr:carboxypeptidase regulatory-like domain-containing protein [Xanthomonadaceae bacterium]MDE2279821.1 carboxypeptidase regulatory-like domain-containing protein [Xanthomonadaceae bacterium]MDE2315002.1 carboxypeptidase regulatory-like domain-containing protein [Xanthomonadaceae bacterium]